jgi:hypothetical protein
MPKCVTLTASGAMCVSVYAGVTLVITLLIGIACISSDRFLIFTGDQIDVLTALGRSKVWLAVGSPADRSGERSP